jgi:hypothetical protein
MRCMHEASLYKENCFITLTYDDKQLPDDGSVDVKTFQDFMKRLRKKYPSKKIRYFHCGEYGSETGRPHYHAVLFGFNFPDLEYWKTTESGHCLYNSPALSKTWGHGFANVGSVTFESCAYVARYIMKKVTGEKAAEHYCGRKPEYTTMSRRPGIGKEWFEKFKDDVFPHDYVVVNGKKVRPPKFYDSEFEKLDEVLFKKIKARRSKLDEKTRLDNDSFRLPVKEKVKKAQISNLKRGL